MSTQVKKKIKHSGGQLDSLTHSHKIQNRAYYCTRSGFVFAFFFIGCLGAGSCVISMSEVGSIYPLALLCASMIFVALFCMVKPRWSKRNDYVFAIVSNVLVPHCTRQKHVKWNFYLFKSQTCDRAGELQDTSLLDWNCGLPYCVFNAIRLRSATRKSLPLAEAFEPQIQLEKQDPRARAFLLRIKSMVPHIICLCAVEAGE
jgi:hypothetical protein